MGITETDTRTGAAQSQIHDHAILLHIITIYLVIYSTLLATVSRPLYKNSWAVNQVVTVIFTEMLLKTDN